MPVRSLSLRHKISVWRIVSLFYGEEHVTEATAVCGDTRRTSTARLHALLLAGNFSCLPSQPENNYTVLPRILRRGRRKKDDGESEAARLNHMLIETSTHILHLTGAFTRLGK